jgi:hypothetical protein
VNLTTQRIPKNYRNESFHYLSITPLQHSYIGR